MATGASSFTATINFVDDILDEGDETVIIKFGTLSSEYTVCHPERSRRVLARRMSEGCKTPSKPIILRAHYWNPCHAERSEA